MAISDPPAVSNIFCLSRAPHTHTHTHTLDFSVSFALVTFLTLYQLQANAARGGKKRVWRILWLCERLEWETSIYSHVFDFGI